MATGHTLPRRRSKLAELIRSPFRSSVAPAAPNDWHIPYNGPIEVPRHTVASPVGVPAFESPQHREGPSSVTGSMGPEIKRTGSGREHGSKRAAHRKPPQKVISIDTGGIGESPVTVLDDPPATARRPSAAHIFSHHKDKQPAPVATPYVGARLNHPFNPHGTGYGSYAFPTTTTTTTPSSNTTVPSIPQYLSLDLPSPAFPAPVASPTADRHPYSANPVSRGPADPTWPNNVYGTGSSRSRAPTFVSTNYTGASASTTQTSNSEWDHSDSRTRPNDIRSRTEHTMVSGSVTPTNPHQSSPIPRQPITKSRSTPQQLNSATLASSSQTVYHIQSHPYALSPIPSSAGVSLKPPIPRKSPGLLQRLRASVSAPNLAARSQIQQQQQPQQGEYQRKGSVTSITSRRGAVPAPIDVNAQPPYASVNPNIPMHTGMAHTSPVTLVPASSMQSLAHPRPRFVAALVPPDDPVPGSPYPLSRPPFSEFDNSDENILAQCLPTPQVHKPTRHHRNVKTVEQPPERDPLASFSSPGQEDGYDGDEKIDHRETDEARRKREREDILAKAVRDNELLSAERQRWEKAATKSLGNKRSRSLSTQNALGGPRRSVSHSALASAANAQAPQSKFSTTGLRSRANTATRGTPAHMLTSASTGNLNRSRSTTLDSMAPGRSRATGSSGELHSWHSKSSGAGTGNSLRYLASAAFGHTSGHSHSRQISVESTSVRSSAGAPQHGLHSNGTHSRGSSADVVRIGAVPGGARRGESSSHHVSSGERNGDVDQIVDIRSQRGDDDVRAAVEQRIGLALSPSPAFGRPGDVAAPQIVGHPYASPSRAGPHPANLAFDASVPYKDDVATRHRLPPQIVHAHKRSLSTGNGQSTMFSGSTSPKSLVAPSSLPSPMLSPHPFNASPEKRARPTSGRVEQAFEEALIASSASSDWPASLSAELRDGDPDPFRRGPVTAAPTTSPRSHPSTPRTSPRKPVPRPSPTISHPPTPKTIKRRSRSMSDFSDRKGAISVHTASPPLSPSAPTFGLAHSRSGSQHTEYRPSLDDEYQLQRHRNLQNNSNTPPTEDSSVVSIANPNIVLADGGEDLDEFRDLFYRPNNAYSSESSPRESMSMQMHMEGGRPLSGSSTLWNVLSPALGVEFELQPPHLPSSVHQSDQETLGYSDGRTSRYVVMPDDGSFRVRSVDASMPSIRPGAQRHSSTPQIEQPDAFPEARAASPASLAPDEDDTMRSLPAAIPRPLRPGPRISGGTRQSQLTADGSLLSPGGNDNSSSSEDWYRFSHATASSSRMSNIIRGFPTPPDATPPAGSILGAYFPDDDAPLTSPFATRTPGVIPSTPEVDTDAELPR